MADTYLTVLRELSIGWQLSVVAIVAVTVLVIVLNLIYIAPTIWREGLAQTRVWLTPDHPKVVSIEERRQQLAAAALSYEAFREHIHAVVASKGKP